MTRRLTTTDNQRNGSPAADDTGACDMSDNDNEIVPSIARGGNFPRATGEEDVEGHGGNPEAEPESIARGGNFPRATGDEDETPAPDGLK